MTEYTDYISIFVDVILIMFLTWFHVVRRGIDKRIDKLADILTSAADIISNNFSWKKTAEEIAAMEEVLGKRHKIEKDSESKRSLEYLIKAKTEHVDTEMEFRMIVKFLQDIVPEKTRKGIADEIEKQGGVVVKTRVLKALRGEPLDKNSIPSDAKPIAQQ